MICYHHGDAAGHEHSDHHHHEAGGEHTPAERKALLKYMAEHNEHHAEELHELAHELSDDASAKVHEAVDLFAQGNALLREALKLLEKEEN